MHATREPSSLKSRPDLCHLNPLWRMQNLKRYQDHLSLTFTNPIYALTLKLLPWLSQVKEIKKSMTGIQQVQQMTVTINSMWNSHAGITNSTWQSLVTACNSNHYSMWRSSLTSYLQIVCMHPSNTCWLSSIPCHAHTLAAAPFADQLNWLMYIHLL